MKKALMYVGLLAILPLLTVSITGGTIGIVDASGPSSGAKGAMKEPVPEPIPVVELTLIPIGEPQKASTSTKTYKGFNEDQYDDTLTYRTIYRVVNSGDGDVMNVKISVKSDTETIEAMLQGHLDPKHSVITAMIKADDPKTIDATITSWELS